jgi:hypothetical protein
MIFCEEPWCNEPGRESQTGSTQSKGYSKTIRRLTVQYALLDWIKHVQVEKIESTAGASKEHDSPNTCLSRMTSHVDNGIWSLIAEKHFQTHARYIIRTVSKWASEGLGNTTFNPFFADAGPTQVLPGGVLLIPDNSVPPSVVQLTQSLAHMEQTANQKQGGGTSGAGAMSALPSYTHVGQPSSSATPQFAHSYPPFQQITPLSNLQVAYGIPSAGNDGLMALATASSMQGHQPPNPPALSPKMKHKFTQILSSATHKKHTKAVATGSHSSQSIPSAPPAYHLHHAYPSPFWTPSSMSSFVKSSPQSGYFQPGLSPYGVPTPLSDPSSPMQQHPPQMLPKNYDNYAIPPSDCPFGLPASGVPSGHVLSPAKLSAMKALYTQQLPHHTQSAAGPSTAPPPHPVNRVASTRKPAETKLDENTRSLLRNLARLVPDETDEMRIHALRLVGSESEKPSRGKKVGHH